MFGWLRTIIAGPHRPEHAPHPLPPIARLTPPSAEAVPCPAQQPAQPIYRLLIEHGTASRFRQPQTARWAPPGSPVTVNGVTIGDGMVYVGAVLGGTDPNGSGENAPSPCLINPALKVAVRPAKPEDAMGYYPSYSRINPNHRRTYLNWLGSGKCDPATPLGYVFLYFYGIERRLLVDQPPPAEEASLVAELERLRGIYGENRSFAYYSRSLLDLVDLRRLSTSPGGLADYRPVVAPTRGMPLPLQVKLGVQVASRQPLDADHAIVGFLSLRHDQGGLKSSIVVSRAHPELVQLASKRFAERFAEGFKLRDNAKGKLEVAYKAATAGLGIEVRVVGPKPLPDPVLLNWGAMAAFMTETCEGLTRYARLAGKDGLAAELALPAELGDGDGVTRLRHWLARLPTPLAEVSLDALARWGVGRRRDTVDAREISAMLARVGYGMEPDPTHGGRKPEAAVVLFRAADKAGVFLVPGPMFPRASLAMAVLASAETGPVDGSRLIAQLASTLGLLVVDTLRLAARYRFLRGRAISAARLKAFVSILSPTERVAAVNLATSIVAAVGEPDRSFVAVLEKFHDACGVDRKSLYLALHRGEAPAPPPPAEPIVVEQATTRTGYRIPEPPKALVNDGVTLDAARISQILQETSRVASVLASIYEDEELVEAPPPKPATGRFGGLDDRYLPLVERLAANTDWDRPVFEEMARELGIMPDGAIEAINEWAFDALGDALIEEGDPLHVNHDLLVQAQKEAV